MYFWNINALIQSLRLHQVTTRQTFIYCISVILLSVAGLMPHTFLPLLYYIFFSTAKLYIEQQIATPALQVTVFHENDTAFALIALLICVLGIMYCYTGYAKRSTTEFIKQYLCLSVPLTIKIALLTLFLFVIIMGGITGFFWYKLTILEYTPLPKPNYFNPIKLLFKALTVIPFVREGLDQMTLFLKIQALFDQINTVSYVLYYAAQGFALLELLWFFKRMRSYIQKI